MGDPATRVCDPNIVFILWQLLGMWGGTQKLLPKFHLQSISLSTGGIDELPCFPVVNSTLSPLSQKGLAVGSKIVGTTG